MFLNLRLLPPWYSQDSTLLTLMFWWTILWPFQLALHLLLRVGQLELFARRTRSNAHPKALEELSMIVSHLIEREYKSDINQSLGFADQLVELVSYFASVHYWWLMLVVGYCF